MKPAFRKWLQPAAGLMHVRSPDPEEIRHRIKAVERDIILPIKVAGIAMVLYSFSRSPWFGVVSNTLDVAVESVHFFVGFYVLVNVAFAAVLLMQRRLPVTAVTGSLFAMSMVDNLFLGGLVVISGGYDSILFWLFVAQVVRNSASTPPNISQLLLNAGTVLCYVVAGFLDLIISENVTEVFGIATGRALDFGPEEHATETFLIRLVVLVLTAACGFGLQVLLENQRRALEEAREFSLRAGQLQSSGRLAAEIAHQIKNPLAIINNAVYSLERATREGRPVSDTQIQIIREEIGRSDKILTELMGYARLSEGRVERLDLRQELDRAIEQVFPPAANYPAQIHRDYFGYFPPLLMLRQHLSEVLVNLLQNARDATNGAGQIKARAHLGPDAMVHIEIEDNGPGIPPERLSQVFEAYYTTKPKGTGLGLAIVKHNVELYGGTVHAESELGKGARFIVTYPARSSIKLVRPS